VEKWNNRQQQLAAIEKQLTAIGPARRWLPAHGVNCSQFVFIVFSIVPFVGCARKPGMPTEQANEKMTHSTPRDNGKFEHGETRIARTGRIDAKNSVPIAFV
jgi:hypothetical protein